MMSSAKASLHQNNLEFSIFQIWSWCPYLEFGLFSKMADDPDERAVESLPFCTRIFNRLVFWLRLEIFFKQRVTDFCLHLLKIGLVSNYSAILERYLQKAICRNSKIFVIKTIIQLSSDLKTTTATLF